MNRYVSRIASATASVASVSDITRPSFIQRLGYTAAIAAASSPARLPATARPSSPITSTTAAPNTVMVRRMRQQVVAARVELLGHPRRSA